MNFGSKMLQIVSIFMIVFGALAAVLSFVYLAIVLSADTGEVPLLLAYIVLTGGGVAELVAGIIGVLNYTNASKAKMLIICGIVVAAVTVLGYIFMMIGDGSFDVLTLISGLLFPILFIVSAVRMKNSSR